MTFTAILWVCLLADPDAPCREYTFRDIETEDVCLGVLTKVAHETYMQADRGVIPPVVVLGKCERDVGV